MISSSAFMLLLGLLATFAPQELLTHAGISPQPPLVLIVQLSGAL